MAFAIAGTELEKQPSSSVTQWGPSQRGIAEGIASAFLAFLGLRSLLNMASFYLQLWYLSWLVVWNMFYFSMGIVMPTD